MIENFSSLCIQENQIIETSKYVYWWELPLSRIYHTFPPPPPFNFFVLPSKYLLKENSRKTMPVYVHKYRLSTLCS